MSAAQLVSFENAVSGAETAFSEQTAALSTSRSSTENKNDAFDILLALIGSTMSTIDAYFKTTDDPGVYTRAQIDPPKPVELDLASFPDGTLRLSFKVTAAGSVFEIQRITTDAEGQEGEWATIAVTGDKMYTDPSVPRGLRRVEYRVRAVLPNNQASEWSTPVPFNFGSQGSEGGPMASAEAA